MQLSLFDYIDAFEIVEPVSKTFQDKTTFIIAVVVAARKKPRVFKYRGRDAAGLVEKVFSVESPGTKVTRE